MNVLKQAAPILSRFSEQSLVPTVTAVRYRFRYNPSHRDYDRAKGKVLLNNVRTPDSTFVTSGSILVRQLGLLYFPGLNVGVGGNFCLYAKEHGRVFITTEKCNPNWKHKYIRRFFGAYADTGAPIYKKYMHVVPIPMENNFKLVEQI